MPTLIDNSLAPFTYTGDWDIYEYEPGKYYARFLTSGTLTPKHPFVCDVFLVGGGGGGSGSWLNTYSLTGCGGCGGGGGYTANKYNVSVTKGIPISVTIGQGGTAGIGSDEDSSAPTSGGRGGTTYFGNYSAAGGYGGTYSFSNYLSRGNGGDGGSGGGAGGENDSKLSTSGGSNGSDGETNSGSTRYKGGKGQGTTTKPFGGDVAPFNTMLFAGGGGGGASERNKDTGGAGGAGGGGKGGGYRSSMRAPGAPGTPNTGGGGGGSGTGGNGGSGGSGIVIIRGILVLNRPVFVSGIDWVPHKVNQPNLSGQKVKAGWTTLNGNLTKVY